MRGKAWVGFEREKMLIVFKRFGSNSGFSFGAGLGLVSVMHWVWDTP